jgi:hypothetical protein
MFDLRNPTHRDLAAGIVRIARHDRDIPHGVVRRLKDFHLIAVNPDGWLRLTGKGSQVFNRIERGDEVSAIDFQ